MSPYQKVAVIGGGLAGLASAVFLARGGKSVTIIEQSTTLGGRARTVDMEGFYFNQGPHALFPAGPGVRILEDLGVKYKGNVVATDNYYIIRKGKRYGLPTKLWHLLTTKLLRGLRGKAEAIKFFASLNKINLELLQGVSLEEWLDKQFHSPEVKDLIKLLSRLATYSNDSKTISAAVALSQIKVAFAGGVFYVDEGWQTIVNSLIDMARNANVKFVTGKRVGSIGNNNRPGNDSDGRLGWRITLSCGDGDSVDGRSMDLYFDSIIIADGPKEVYSLLVNNADINQIFLQQLKDQINPVRVATLDIALSRLPDPDVYGAYGIDAPLYLSLHSAFAKLAPGSGKGVLRAENLEESEAEAETEGVLFHAMKNLDASVKPDPKADRDELERFVDMLQPGWRNVVVRQRFLPNMVVYNTLVQSRQGGMNGRPDVEVPGTKNLYIIGDWVGPEGLLADASLSSAKRAAKKILEKAEKNKMAKMVHVSY
ncbi:MAG: NAD(P)/FAD-dependent oxidoreductase [Thermoproteota archaeon]|nr:NAD(P)/FAD-dependent oxidoreductase [Thermoproteota archaeon]